MLFNILTTNHKYSLLNRDNLRQPIPMQLSRKEKTFSQFVSAFLKCRLNFEHFQKKMTLIADLFHKLLIPKSVVKHLPKNCSLRGPFDKQHSKGKTLLKFELHHL